MPFKKVDEIASISVRQLVAETFLEQQGNKLRHHILWSNTESPPSQYGGAIFLIANPPFIWGSRINVVFFPDALVGPSVDQDGA